MRPFGELEAAIMNRLWSIPEPLTVRDVLTDLRPERPLAYTTVMTVMDTLHRKGWLRRERQGRAYRYWPALSREQHRAAMMRDALSGSEDHAAAFVHFLESMTEAETAALRKALRQQRRRSPR